MPRPGEDKYANLANATVVESAASTLTFIELLTGISLGQGMGMIIDQIDYYPGTGALEDLVAAGDFFETGWTTSNTITTLGIDNKSVIHNMRMHSEVAIGTPASAGHPVTLPKVYQFFPPIILAAPRIFLGVVGSSMAAAVTIRSRLYFRYVKLSAQEYLELAESFILVG